MNQFLQLSKSHMVSIYSWIVFWILTTQGTRLHNDHILVYCYLYVVDQLCSIKKMKYGQEVNIWFRMKWCQGQLQKWLKYYNVNFVWWAYIMMGLQIWFVTMKLLSGVQPFQNLHWRRRMLLFVITVYAKHAHEGWFKLLRKVELQI